MEFKSQLQKLRTLLQNSLDIEAKSTEGEWQIDPAQDGDVITHQKITIVQTTRINAVNNAIFITNAKRLDRMKTEGLLELLNVVEWFLEYGNYEDSCRAEGHLKSLLTIFAKELE